MTTGALQDLLLDCMRFDGNATAAARIQALDDGEWAGLLVLAAQQKIEPLLHYRLKAMGMLDSAPVAAISALRDASFRNAARNMLVYRDLKAIATALNAEAIPLVVLKGAFLAQVVYSSPELRQMVDIDLLVAGANLSRAHACMTALGYENQLQADVETSGTLARHLPTYSRLGSVAKVEIHGSLTDPDAHYAVTPDEVLERSTAIELAGCNVRALCPEDLLLHLCIHCAYQHEFRAGLRPLCDIAAAVRKFGDTVMWDSLVERAIRWRCSPGVALAFTAARDLVGAGIADTVLSKLSREHPDAGLRASVRSLVFNPQTTDASAEAGSNLLRMVVRPGAAAKLRVAAAGAVPSRAQLSAMYGTTTAFPKALLAYPLHWGQLLRRYAPIALRLARRDDQAVTTLKARLAIQNWLSGAAD